LNSETIFSAKYLLRACAHSSSLALAARLRFPATSERTITSVCVAMKTRLPRTPFSACLRFSMLQHSAVCCSLFQRDAVCVAMKTKLTRTPLSACLRFSMLQSVRGDEDYTATHAIFCMFAVENVAGCCSALQCVAVCCSVRGDED